MITPEHQRVAASDADRLFALARPTARRQFALVMVILSLFWIAVVVIVMGTFSARAWDDRHDARGLAASSASPMPAATVASGGRPAGVPAAAQMVERDLVLGDVSDFIYFFRDSVCLDDVLTIAMSKAIIFAETSCDHAVPPATLPRLVGHPVRVRLVGSQLFLEDLFIAAFRFDVGRVWVQTR